MGEEGEMKIKQIVYVQPGSIYLSIGSKTSSVRNIVVYETWLVSVTGKNSIRQISCFSTREKVPGIHLFRHHSHRWLSLTAASSHQPEGEGPCDSCALLLTTESCTLRLWRHVKKLCIPQKRFNGHFLWFWNRTFPNRGIPWNRLSSHA